MAGRVASAVAAMAAGAQYEGGSALRVAWMTEAQVQATLAVAEALDINSKVAAVAFGLTTTPAQADQFKADIAAHFNTEQETH